MTDAPERIRALAHPLRLRLLDLLDEGELTATRCADLTGESVASCSFHLRMLAKYGYIEPAERRGREKPWRVTSMSRIVDPDYTDPASVRATQVLAGLELDREVERIRVWLSTVRGETPQWLNATTFMGARFWATADELRQLRRDIEAAMQPLAGRWTDAARRPTGARPVNLIAIINPDPPREDE